MDGFVFPSGLEDLVSVFLSDFVANPLPLILNHIIKLILKSLIVFLQIMDTYLDLI